MEREKVVAQAIDLGLRFSPLAGIRLVERDFELVFWHQLESFSPLAGIRLVESSVIIIEVHDLNE